MDKHLFFWVFLLLLPSLTRAQTIDDCPSASDLGTARVICTYGTAINPYRDTGIVPLIHYYNNSTGYIELGDTTMDTLSRGESITMLYLVDTTQATVLTVDVNTNILYTTSISVTPYIEFQVLDSIGQPINDPCLKTLHTEDGYPFKSNIRLQAYHNQTLQLRITNVKPGGPELQVYSSIKFSCYNSNSDSISLSTSGGLCGSTPVLSVPNGHQYLTRWYYSEFPDSSINYSSRLIISDLTYHPRCQFYYLSNNGDSLCVFKDMAPPPVITLIKMLPVLDIDTLDIIQSDSTYCHMRIQLTDRSFSALITQTPTRVDTTILSNSSNTYSQLYFNDTLLTESRPILTLSPGWYNLRIDYYYLPEGHTTYCSRSLTIDHHIPPFCSLVDSPAFRSCPSVYDLNSFRTVGTYGYWYTNGISPPIFVNMNYGIAPNRHTLITTQGTDSFTGNLLSLIPPGESASIRLGNSDINSQTESITFYYIVDTNQSDLLLLRYAAVMEDPQHNPAFQPRFTFEILDSSGNHINANCYSASFIASSELGWNNAPNGILWKDWTTVGADLSSVHNQMVAIRLSTYDCAESGHFGYAYFTLGCYQRHMQAIHCADSSHYTAPDGFSYQWYPDGYPDSILATTRHFATTSNAQFHCRLGFIGAPAGTNCYTTISTGGAINQYPRTDFSTSVIDTVGCNLTVQIVNTSHIVTEYTPDSILTQPCTYSQISIDGAPPLLNTDTIIATLSPGYHSIHLIAWHDNFPCTDTLDSLFFVDYPCRTVDTLFVCPENLPVTVEGIPAYSDTIIAIPNGDTLIVHIVTLLPTNDSIIFDTIVQNQLPYTSFNITISDTHGIDTVIILPGIFPQCDTHFHYNLHIFPNIHDTLFFFLCPNTIPFSINDTISVRADTAIVLHGTHGEDSVIHYRVTLLHDSDTSITDTILESQLPWLFRDTLFTDSVRDFPIVLVNEAGCDSVIHYRLFIFWDGDHCDTTLTFPTLVTPNGDGINDRFVIGGLLENNCFRFNDLLIYDRTGQLVYHGHNIARDEDFWDPAAHRAPDATYFYVFKAHGVTIHTMHQGVIEVLR